MYYSNVAYSPEAFGLTELANVDVADNYEFNAVIAWQHLDGSIYWASDSGCSCPTPFEGYISLADLNKIASQSDLATFYGFMQAHQPYNWLAPNWPGSWHADSLAMYNKVEAAYRNANI